MLSRKSWVAATLVLPPLLVTAPLAWFAASTGRRRTTAERAEARPVALVLGAGLRDGRPTLLLARRLDVAADLYHRGTVDAVLVSGADDEPVVMHRYLRDAGVPDAKIVQDAAGFRTYDSCVRAREVYGVRSAIVVTQRFHLPRAVALCRTVGIDATGVGDPATRSRGLAIAYGWLREVPAAVKATRDAVLRPAPREPGAPTAALADAVRAPR